MLLQRSGKSLEVDANISLHYQKRVMLMDDEYAFICDNSPSISEDMSAEYARLEVPQMPFAIQSYKGSSSRSWNISDIKLISRTFKEATINNQTLWRLRSWTKGEFGNTSASYGRPLGMPPKVLSFTAYSSHMIGENSTYRIYRIPVVITNLTIDYPNDVDYIPDDQGNMIPIIQTITISLTEQHSPSELSNFSLDQFKMGKMLNF